MLNILRGLFIGISCWLSTENVATALFPEEQDFKVLASCLPHSSSPQIANHLEKKLNLLKKASYQLKKGQPVQKRVWDTFVTLSLASRLNEKLAEALQNWTPFMWQIANAGSPIPPSQKWGTLSGQGQERMTFLKLDDSLQNLLFLPHLALDVLEPHSKVYHKRQHDFLTQDGKLLSQPGFYIVPDQKEIELSLIIYLGAKSSPPFAAFQSGWIFPYEGQNATISPSSLQSSYFFPIPETYLPDSFPSQTEAFNRFAHCMGMQEDTDDLSVLPSLQEFQKTLSFEQVLERLMRAWLEIPEEKEQESEQEIEEDLSPLSVSAQDSSHTQEVHFVRRPHTFPNTKGKPLTPHGQPTLTRPQNAYPKGGVLAHVKAFFEKHPHLKGLQIKRIKTKGSHTVTHFEKGSPTTYVKPHGSYQHKK